MNLLIYFFLRHNYPAKYEDRVKKIDPKLSDDPRVLSKVRNFFQKIENKIESAAYYGKQLQQLRRAERGGGPNTGIEALFGLPSIIPNILKKIFGPSNVQWGKTPKDNEVDIEFMRHINKDFVENELPYIQNEAHLQDNILKMYQKAGVGKGYSPILDEIIRNRLNLYYTREINPQDSPYISAMKFPFKNSDRY